MTDYSISNNGASMSTTGALVNDGIVRLDTTAGDGGSSLTVGGRLTNGAGADVEIEIDANAGDGGSSLTVGGTLTNGAGEELTFGNATLSATDTVTAASLDNTGPSGQGVSLISLTGFGANQALLDVSGAAGFGSVSVPSDVVLTGDSAIEFASGQITSVTGDCT
jgi:hypothetical protein